MYKSLFASLLISFILSNFLYSQESNTLQINGGIVMPKQSSKGLAASLQFNYPVSHAIELYFSAGYSAWDRFHIQYLEDATSVQHKQRFTSYSADGHSLVPIFLGGKLNIHTNKIFTSFLNFELGYSHLTFNSYQQQKEINPETGEILNYFPDLTTQTKHEENLFGFGIGAGISHPMGRKLNLILSFKLNGYLNSGYYNFFTGGSFNTALLAGFSFNI